MAMGMGGVPVSPKVLLAGSGEQVDRFAGGGGHAHLPAVRPLHLQWHRDADGAWVAGGEDPKHWEIVCPQCGDTDGPAEDQSIAVQKLRGPYRSHLHASAVANKHFDAH